MKLTEEYKLRALLYEAIVELSYVQEAEDISQCASAKGAEIVRLGMELLGVKDLSAEKLEELEISEQEAN